MKKIKLLPILLLAILLTGVSCSKDKSDVDPLDAVTLNMLDETNGKTMLGNSTVYINKANNFFSTSSLIADLGTIGGLGTQVAPQLTTLVKEVAVSQGHTYQIFDPRMLLLFPSGVRAMRVDASYYRMCVISPLKNEGEIKGSVVKYISRYPETYGLPDYQHVFGEVAYAGDKVEISLPSGAECSWDSYEETIFEIFRDGRKLNLILKQTPTSSSGEIGGHPFHIRMNNVYTTVIVMVVH